MSEGLENMSQGESEPHGWRVPGAVFRRERLSAEEALELAAQLAELARAGLPLPAGLRALAAELPRRPFHVNRVALVLREMAAEIERGRSLDDAVLSQAARLPPSVHGLLLAGIRSGRLAEALEEFVAIQQQQIELRNRVWRVAAYPVLLLVLSGVVMAFFFLAVVPQFG